jgi:hypothetical protein
MEKKIVISTPAWLELEAELAALIVDATVDAPWQQNEYGDESYTEEGQDSFIAAVDQVNEVLNQTFERGEG